MCDLPVSLLIENESDDIEDQLENVVDYNMHLVHRVVAIAYDKVENMNVKIQLHEIYNWILRTCPTFEEFLKDEFRSGLVYEYAKQRRPFDESAQELLVDLEAHFEGK